MGIPSWAVRGAKVVFVGYRGPDAYFRDGKPRGLHRKGVTYTISAAWISGMGFPAILVAETGSSCRLRCFRPAVPPKSEADDLALFLPLLDPPLVRIPHHGEVA